MILVVGATGQLGGLIARTLLDRHEPVRALVRSGSSYDELVDAGAQAVTGDLKDPESLRPACQGVDTVITTANSIGRGGEDTVESVDREGNANLVDAAAAAEVRRFVFTSALGAHSESPMPFLQAKGEAEQRLRDSKIAWTVLQPNLFMDTWIPAVVGGPALAGQPVTLVGEGRRRHSFVAMHDVAAYAVAAVKSERAKGQTLVIGGPEPLSWRDVVAAFERELGHDIPIRTVSPGEPVPGLLDFVNELLVGLETYDSPIDMNDLAETYGVRPTPLTEFVRGFVAAARPLVG
jgi:NADH dehydrogenase